MEKVQVQPEFNVANEMNDLLKQKLETELIPFTPPAEWYNMAWYALTHLNLTAAGEQQQPVGKIRTMGEA
jgi:hypothetical protein